MNSSATHPSSDTAPGTTGHTTAAATGNTPSAELLDQHGMLRIEHRGAIYTLRATSKGGLILTK